jgi:hypothetical protein
MQRLGGGLFFPLSLYNEELEDMPHPFTHQDFKDGNRMQELFSGRKPGIDQGSALIPTTPIQRQLRSHWSRTQNRTLQRPDGHPHIKYPQKDLSSCSVTAHKCCGASDHPGCTYTGQEFTGIIFKHSLRTAPPGE